MPRSLSTKFIFHTQSTIFGRDLKIFSCDWRSFRVIPIIRPILKVSDLE